MDENERFVGAQEFIEDPAAAEHGIAEEVVVGDESNVYVADDGTQYIRGEDGDLYYYDNLDVLDDVHVVIADGTENDVYVAEDAQFQEGEPQPKEAKLEDGSEPVLKDDLDDEDDLEEAGIIIQQIPPQGLKRKNNRQYGSCCCPECGATFINQARLERHMVVHQLCGSHLCPLCGKIFKYEYNLFYHWRRTCRELTDLVSSPLRTSMEKMDVYALRQLVDDIAIKKPEIGPVELGISKSILFQTGPTARLEIPSDMRTIGRRGTACNSCGVFIPTSHARRHYNHHQALGPFQPDDPIEAGGYFCDLCGLCYRYHKNLITHWRSSCPEIQANLPSMELCLDDHALREMVANLLTRVATDQKPNLDAMMGGQRGNGEPGTSRAEPLEEGDVVVDDNDFSMPDLPRSHLYNDRETGIIYADDFGSDAMMILGPDGRPQMAQSERSKWKLPDRSGGSNPQCGECGRVFANQGRLDRHLMGFHSNFGSISCILCGNRFKYEYNLLFHYRKSCPYTKIHIEQMVRDQLPAADLRKMVRGIAQTKIKLEPNQIAGLHFPTIHTLRDAAKQPAKDQPKSRVCPPQSLQIRPDLSERSPKACPICEVIFYGVPSMHRHLQTAHGMNSEAYQAILRADNETKLSKGSPQDEQEELEPMPKLVRQVPEPIRFIDHDGDEIQSMPAECLQNIRQLMKTQAIHESDSIIIESEDQSTQFDVEIVDIFIADGAKNVVINVKSQPKEQDVVIEEDEVMDKVAMFNKAGEEEEEHEEGAVIMEEVVDATMPL